MIKNLIKLQKHTKILLQILKCKNQYDLPKVEISCLLMLVCQDLYEIILI